VRESSLILHTHFVHRQQDLHTSKDFTFCTLAGVKSGQRYWKTHVQYSAGVLRDWDLTPQHTRAN
jgi:hypothetical protein